MPDVNLTLAYPMQTIFHCLTLGLVLGPTGFLLDLPGFALDLPSFLDTKLVSAYVKGLEQCVGGLAQMLRGLGRGGMYAFVVWVDILKTHP